MEPIEVEISVSIPCQVGHKATIGDIRKFLEKAYALGFTDGCVIDEPALYATRTVHPDDPIMGELMAAPVSGQLKLQFP